MVAYVNADIGFTACVCTRMYAERLAPASWGAGELEELCICTLLVPEVPASKTTKLRTKRRRGASQQNNKTANKEAQRCQPANNKRYRCRCNRKQRGAEVWHADNQLSAVCTSGVDGPIPVLVEHAQTCGSNTVRIERQTMNDRELPWGLPDYCSDAGRWCVHCE